MKKTLRSSICFFTLFLTSCSLFYPTPELVNKYSQLDFEYTEAKHEDWSRHYLNDEWEYSFGSYKGIKDGHYFHLYKNDKLVFNYEPNNDFYISDVLLKNNKVYFIMATLFLNDGNNTINTSVNYIDEDFNHHKIYETEDCNLERLNVESSISFIESTRETNSKNYVVEINFDGSIINKFYIDISNTYYFTSFSVVDNKNFLIGLKSDTNDYFLLNKDNKSLKKVGSLPANFVQYSIEYKNDTLHVLGYAEKVENFNLKNVSINEYNNSTLNTLFSIDLPEDYSYYNQMFKEYKDNIYLSFSVCEKDKSKSNYDRYVILKCNESDNSINSLYKNKNLSSSVFYNNGHIYLGNFRNDVYVDNESSGDFIDIDLNQFDK